MPTVSELMAQNISNAQTNVQLQTLLYNVKAYGAEGDGTTDDTSAIQAAIDAAKAAGYGYVFFPPGTYLITDTLNGSSVSSSFNGVSLIGADSQGVTLRYTSFTTKKAAIKYQGGSGALNIIRVSGITFEGSATSVGVECNSIGNVSIEECHFKTNSVGVLMSNDSSGGFTEYCVARRCVFDILCVTAVEFYRGSGNDSFNGSGLDQCKINTATGNSSIIVGTGSNLYNARLDAQVWIFGNGTVIDMQSNTDSTCHGALTLEGDCTVVGGSGTGKLYLAGFVEAFTGVTLGRCIPQNKITRNGSEAGSLNGATTLWTPPTYEKFDMVTGDNITKQLTGIGYALIYIRFEAANYDYRYLIGAGVDGTGGAGFVTTLHTIKSFNGTGWGAPTFAVNTNGELVITNVSFPASGVVANLHITAMAYDGRGAILPTW